MGVDRSAQFQQCSGLLSLLRIRAHSAIFQDNAKPSMCVNIYEHVAQVWY